MHQTWIPEFTKWSPIYKVQNMVQLLPKSCSNWWRKSLKDGENSTTVEGWALPTDADGRHLDDDPSVRQGEKADRRKPSDGWTVRHFMLDFSYLLTGNNIFYPFFFPITRSCTDFSHDESCGLKIPTKYKEYQHNTTKIDENYINNECE